MKDIIENEYRKLSNNLSCSGKCNVLNNIIQLKLSELEFKNVTQHISIDIKNYLNSLVDQAESASIGYDSIEVIKVKELLKDFSLNEKLTYIDYFIRQLQKSSFENEIKSFQRLKTQSIISHTLARNQFYKPCNIYSFIVNFPLLNIFTLVLTFLFIGLLISVVLLPAPFKFMEFLNFEISYQNLSSSYFLNHLVNTFGFFVGIENQFSILAKDTFTMLAYLISKVIIFVYVGNVLFNKLSEFLK